MEDKKLKYELSQEIVQFILQALNRVQVAGVQQAQDLLKVVELLQKPSNSEELEKEKYEELKNKFNKK